MNKILFEIKKGRHYLNPEMEIDVQSDVEIFNGKSYSIKGENGSGKSSFVRNILYKNIKESCKGKIQFLYFDQEIIPQFYFGKAYFSITKDKSIKNIDQLILAIAQLHKENAQYKNNQLILILDETDKYIKTTEILNQFKNFELTYFSISHYNNDNLTYDYTIDITYLNDQMSKLEIQ